MEGERLERLGYLTTEFQRPHSRRDNAASELLLLSVSSNPTRATPVSRRVTNEARVPHRIRSLAFPPSLLPPSYYMQKRENAGKHDRIKAATNFNADWVLIAYVSILGAPARARREIRRENTNDQTGKRYFQWYSRQRNCVIENTHIELRRLYEYLQSRIVIYLLISTHLTLPRAICIAFFYFSDFVMRWIVCFITIL